MLQLSHNVHYVHSAQRLSFQLAFVLFSLVFFSTPRVRLLWLLFDQVWHWKQVSRKFSYVRSVRNVSQKGRSEGWLPNIVSLYSRWPLRVFTLSVSLPKLALIKLSDSFNLEQNKRNSRVPARTSSTKLVPADTFGLNCWQTVLELQRSACFSHWVRSLWFVSRRLAGNLKKWKPTGLPRTPKCSVHSVFLPP